MSASNTTHPSLTACVPPKAAPLCCYSVYGLQSMSGMQQLHSTPPSISSLSSRLALPRKPPTFIPTFKPSNPSPYNSAHSTILPQVDPPGEMQQLYAAVNSIVHHVERVSAPSRVSASLERLTAGTSYTACA